MFAPVIDASATPELRRLNVCRFEAVFVRGTPVQHITWLLVLASQVLTLFPLIFIGIDAFFTLFVDCYIKICITEHLL